MGAAGKILTKALDMSDAARMQRMQKMGMERGFWRGGASPADGPYYTPDKSAAESFAKRHGPGADVREYAIKLDNQFDYHNGHVNPEQLETLAKIMDSEGNSFAAKGFRDIAREEGGLHNTELYQMLSVHSPNPNAALSKLGYDVINAGQELVVLNKSGTVRDAENAAFDLSKKTSENILAGMLPAGIGIAALSQTDQVEAAELFELAKLAGESGDSELQYKSLLALDGLIELANQNPQWNDAIRPSENPLAGKTARFIEKNTQSPMGDSWFQGAVDLLKKHDQGTPRNYGDYVKAVMDFM